MTSYLRGLMDRVKQISVVQNGLETIQIAKETFQLVRQDIATEHEEKIEDLYLKAAVIKSAANEDDFKNRIDFKVVQASGKVGRVFSKKLLRVARKFNDVVLFSKSILNSVKDKTEGVKSYAKANVDNIFGRIRLLTSGMTASVKSKVSVLVDYCSNQIGSIKQFLLNYDCLKGLQAQFDGLRQRFSRVKDTAVQTTQKNWESAAEQTELIKSTLGKSVKNNLSLLTLLLTSNFDIAKNYFNNVEFEVFYAPDKSVKMVDIVRSRVKPNAKKIEEKVVKMEECELVQSPLEGKKLKRKSTKA